MSDEIHRALGRIEGELKGIRKTQTTHSVALVAIDERVNANEVKAAKNGAITGGLMAGFVMILKESFHLGGQG